jgi:hypothetical protein
MSAPKPVKPITCQCGALFGYETAPGVLSMKYRDVYRTVVGGKVSGPCRRCGAQVTWPA